MYTWFAPKGGRILDPFAGGSVRGIVAGELGFKYDGIDLSEKQILANRQQSDKPNWIVGDADDEITKLKDKYDFIFTCPPYYDLERYSEVEEDLSNMDVPSFDDKYRRILTKCAQKLLRNRFLVIVVSEVRELTVTGKYSTGKYKGLVRKTIEFLEDAGLEFYNDLVLYNSQHQASRVSKTYFERNRKIPSVHQNVLVFVKGNPDIATIEIEGGEPMCRVGGKEYLSFRHAAIDIEPNELVASEVERRCRSTKSKYQDWQIIGQETKPNIRYSVDGIPFESPKQIADLIGGDFTEAIARSYINSTNPIYRHWKREEGWDITYEEMYNLQLDDSIYIEKPIISCEGKEFLSYRDAARYFGLSDERIRQKVKSDKYKDWVSLV
jgi:hypothetical protein